MRHNGMVKDTGPVKFIANSTRPRLIGWCEYHNWVKDIHFLSQIQLKSSPKGLEMQTTGLFAYLGLIGEF